MESSHSKEPYAARPRSMPSRELPAISRNYQHTVVDPQELNAAEGLLASSHSPRGRSA